MGNTYPGDPSRKSALKSFVELRLGSQTEKWRILHKEKKEGRTLHEERLLVRNKFVGMEEAAINEIWNKYDANHTGYLSRASVRQLLHDYLKEVHAAIPELISNSFRQRESEAARPMTKRYATLPRSTHAVVPRVLDKSHSLGGFAISEMTESMESIDLLSEEKRQVEIKEQQEKVAEMIEDIETITDSFIRKMDRNNNGRVERKEFVDTFRMLLYTTADNVDLNPAKEDVHLDKTDEAFFFQSPVDHIKASAPRQNFRKAMQLLQELESKADINLKARLQTVCQLLKGVEERIIVKEEDVLEYDRDFTLIRESDDDQQALDFVTGYIPRVQEIRTQLRKHITDIDELDEEQYSPSSRRLLKAKHRTHSYSMPSLPGLAQMGLKDSLQRSPARRTDSRQGSIKKLGLLPRLSYSMDDYPKEVKMMLAKVGTWDDFDVFAVDEASDGNSLLVISTHIMQITGLMKSCGVSTRAFVEFVSEIQDGYIRDNPYHNSVHAADVVHGVSFFMQSDIGRRLPDYLRFAAIFAATIHDVGHPGTNNNFHINTGSRWAYLYNDTSVLENMHLSEAFNALKKSNFSIVRGLTPEDRNRFRQAVIFMVLNTDMSKHGAHTHEFATHIVKKQRNKTKWCADPDDEDYKKDVRLFLNTVIHVSDLANTARPLPLCKQWISRLYREFYTQGDKEKKLGLPVSPLCDRDKPAGARGQEFFMGKIVIPMFASFYMIEPKVKVCMQHLERNLAYWKAESDKEVDTVRSRNSSLNAQAKAVGGGAQGRTKDEVKKLKTPTWGAGDSRRKPLPSSVRKTKTMSPRSLPRDSPLSPPKSSPKSSRKSSRKKHINIHTGPRGKSHSPRRRNGPLGGSQSPSGRR
mmetsp:Transcript_13727/g.26921  ORF Transcript_13727/g.26921 Transcript_13727/m.26921 type:complete len:864 (+) Transcript_13727:89-2680(+)